MILIHQRKIDEAAGHVAEAPGPDAGRGTGPSVLVPRLHLDFGEALLLAYRLPEAKRI